MSLAQRFQDSCALWAVEDGQLTFREPQHAMRFVLENWKDVFEAFEIADGIKNKIATEPIVNAMLDALRTAGEIRAMAGDDEEEMTRQFAILMLKQAGYRFVKEPN